MVAACAPLLPSVAIDSRLKSRRRWSATIMRRSISWSEGDNSPDQSAIGVRLQSCL